MAVFRGRFLFSQEDIAVKDESCSVFLFLYRKTTQCGSAAERKKHEKKNGFRMKPEEVQPVRRRQSKGTHRIDRVTE